MLEFLPQDIRDAIASAYKRERRRKSKLHVQCGGAVFPILRLWEGGFALDGALSPQLRGLVDIYDGSRHIYQGLIVASETEDGEVHCEFKRFSAVCDQQPLDYCREKDAPAGYLPAPRH